MSPRARFRRKSSVAFLLTVLFLAFGAVVLRIGLGAAEAPDQPIAFPHDVHAGVNQIPCLYCHAYARMSTVAGVPTVKKCMGCHTIVATDNEEVKKLRQYWQDKEGIEWKRIYFLPDYVYFPHKRHVNGGVRCQECHGPVEEMKVVTKYSSLEMGWCLNCHRARGVSRDCITCHK